MTRNQVIFTILAGFLLGAAVLGAIYFRDQRGPQAFVWNPADSTTADNLLPAADLTIPTPYVRESDTATPGVAIRSGVESIPPEDHALLLYDPDRPTTFSANYCKIVEYYGLVCIKQPLNNLKPLLDTSLVDSDGKPYKLIGLDAILLHPQYNAVSQRVITILNQAVLDGSNLYIGKLEPAIRPDRLSALTGNAINGIARIDHAKKEWQVSTTLPDFTRQFSGLTVSSTQLNVPDLFTVLIEENKDLDILISVMDDTGNPHPNLVVYKPPKSVSAGSIILDAGEDGQSLEVSPYRDVYYSAAGFTQVIPIMMAVRYTYGDSVWHTPIDYANLTIDESVLIEPDQNINYSILLEMMRRHNFHTTIAIIPAKWDQSDANVVAMLLANQKYFSLAQYGNSGEGYEFYRYNLETVSLNSSLLVPTRTLDEQIKSIQEGYSRIKMLENLTGLKTDPIFILPGGICPEPTFLALRNHNYLATSNLQDTPLDAVRPDRWDYGMDPIVNDYGGFPNMIRRLPDSNTIYQPYFLASVMDLFIGKPVLFSTFPYGRSMFASSMEAFDPLADKMNQLSGEMEWNSLGYIARHVHLEKQNRDGSMSVKMYTPELVLKNTSGKDINTHVFYEHVTDVGVISARVNGSPFPSHLSGNTLQLHVVIPVGEEITIKIMFDKGDR